MALSLELIKENYKDKKVEELEEIWNKLVTEETNKEKCLKNLVENFMYASSADTEKKAVQELLKEKTGKDYSIDFSKTIELELYYNMRKQFAKEHSLKIEEKSKEHLITFEDVFNYVMLKECSDHFVVETFRRFYNNLDSVSEEEKLDLLITLYYDKEDFNNLSKDLISCLNEKYIDVKSLYNKYKKITEDFYNMNSYI